ncbi:glycoside hydrolase family 16 protein [Rhexocercosporidium sp. MPI-PUGE-AT-0058]|nr:glycoside hydrolase family 16 protein [Rhexocercosporidium sp. MPI-PUGE-AT-0058]
MILPRSFLPVGTTLLLLLAAVDAYILVDTFDHTNFFDQFSFFTARDPTLGFVDYVTRDSAHQNKLLSYENNQVYLGVDHTTYAPKGGRSSVRLTSNAAYNQGLFIADIAHMPMFGPNWPASGEIDIIEGVNAQLTNSITLHTSPGCTISNPNSQPGTVTQSTDCNLSSAQEGCSVRTSSPKNFGRGFNALGGGVYAMQWASSGIYRPNTWAWGQPLATFESVANGGCDFNRAFRDQNLVFDTTFCGTWAGSVWGSSSCSNLAPTCEQYVRENPEAFREAYWLINSVKVYL